MLPGDNGVDPYPGGGDGGGGTDPGGGGGGGSDPGGDDGGGGTDPGGGGGGGSDPGGETPPEALLFRDGLENSFLDVSTARRELASTAVVRTGARAIAFEPDTWQGLAFMHPRGFSVEDYDALELWVHGGATGRQQVRIAAFTSNGMMGAVPLASLLASGEIQAGRWERARVSLARLGIAGGSIHGVWIQDQTGAEQGTLHVDDLKLVKVGMNDTPSSPPPPLPAPATGAVVVDPFADRRPINPHVYGANFGSSRQLNRQRFAVRRWGGNQTTRYAWDVDVSNRAADWFFLNVPEENPNPAALPHGSAADRYIDETRAAGAEVLVTVPMIGWTPRDRSYRWGFSVAKYGRQQATECTSGSGEWCRSDAGNGRWPDGSWVSGNDPADTSRRIGPEYVIAWLRHIASRVGRAGEGGVRFFALDNEMTLWNSTHRDVHPEPVGFDEVWDKTRRYASAIKAEDPRAELFGPMPWGWCAYFGGSSECGGGPDQLAHGGLPLLAWYLEQVCAYERQYGVRLIDYLTIHYYPQANGVFSQDDSRGTEALRLRALRSLYDPHYVDESWIGQPVELIPRMKRWIAAHCPGTKLAITEYNFGSDNGISGALAQAEALAIFGREGVDLATRWVAPNDGARTEDAFALFRNYDGAGGMVLGDSVRAQSWNVDTVGAYAVQGAGSTLYVLLFNKATDQQSVSLMVRGGLSGEAALYGFDAGRRLQSRGRVQTSAGGLRVDLPARSATLVVARRAGT